MAVGTKLSPEAERRRTGNNLRILGVGVILFGLWSILKPALIAVAAPALRGGYNLSPEDRTAATVIGIVVCAAVIILLRLHVGLSAWREGSGIPQGRGYVIWAVLMVLFNVLLLGGILLLTIRFQPFDELNAAAALDTFASLLVDTTSDIILLELIWNAVKLKRMNRREGR